MTERERIWRRFPGDDWAAFEALPAAVRRRMQEHAYDAWAVNALMLWRAFRRRTACSGRAERRLLRYLDECEALERRHFADAHRRRHGIPLPHDGACATVVRYGPSRSRPEAGRGPSDSAGRGIGSAPASTKPASTSDGEQEAALSVRAGPSGRGSAWGPDADRRQLARTQPD